jgi:hypothetical protein
LLQAAGGTLPVIKRDERGVFVMVESADHGHAAKPAAAPPGAEKKAPAAAAPVASAPAAPTAPKPTQAPVPAAPKGEARPDRTLMKRYTYSGAVDTGPVPGESFAQKVERLRGVAAGAKRRADEGGDSHAAPAVAPTPAPAPKAEPAAVVETPAPVAENVAAPAPAPAAAHSATSSSGPDRALMRRSTYCGVVDTGPVPGESFAQKVERLRALSAAAKQRAEGG